MSGIYTGVLSDVLDTIDEVKDAIRKIITDAVMSFFAMDRITIFNIGLLLTAIGLFGTVTLIILLRVLPGDASIPEWVDVIADILAFILLVGVTMLASAIMGS
jgi:hypothetical protein